MFMKNNEQKHLWYLKVKQVNLMVYFEFFDINMFL